MAAGGCSEADDGYVHILVDAADACHETQIFRMHREKQLKALARTYISFRKMELGDAMRFEMSTLKHGKLDPAATAASYEFSNGENVVFTEVSPKAGEEPEVMQPKQDRVNSEIEQKQPQPSRPTKAEEPQPQPSKPAAQTVRGRDTQKTGRFQRLASIANRKKIRKASAKQKGVKKFRKASAKQKGAPTKQKGKRAASSAASGAASGQWAHVYQKALPENMSAKPDVDPSMCKSNIVKTGPAKGWCVTAFFKEYKNANPNRVHDTVICWRVSSPGRSRTFDTFTSSRGTPNLKDAVDEGVFTQITTAVKPELTKAMREKRADIEGQTSDSRSSGGRKSSTPQKNERPGGKTSPRTAEKNQVAAKKELDTPARLPKPLAKRARVNKNKLAEDKNWMCGCVAHLRRQPICTPPSNLQPPLVHLQKHMTIGRAQTCDLVIDSTRAPQMISRCHALLQCEDLIVTLTDQGSLNGVVVNGQRLNGKKVLAHGDEITFGIASAQPELDYVLEMRPTVV